LLSVGERSFGAQVIGVDPAKEAGWSTLAGKVAEGRYLEGPGEVVLGSVLARNLAAAVGDEVVLLGTAKEGGVAAAVVEVVGTFTSGIADLDRGIAQIDIGEFREGWALAEEEVHAVILLADSVSVSERIAGELAVENDGTQWLTLDWRALMPEVEQTMELKYVSVQFFFGLIAIIVSFSVVNTFMMTVFERTPEFGMLMAVGMRPGAIMLQLLIEAFWLALLGISLGVAFSAALLLPLSATGIPLPEASAQLLAQFNMPERMYPGFSLTSVWVASLIMLVGTQFAAIVPALRIRRMRPVEALRASE
jgi:ABC-type lipoprotein release transport system permease subunit